MLAKPNEIKLEQRKKEYNIITFLFICSSSCWHNYTFSNSPTLVEKLKLVRLRWSNPDPRIGIT